MIPSWFKPLAYGVLTINSLILLLVAVDYLFLEVDLFLIVWMSSILLFVTVPLGVVCFIYSLFHLRQQAGRCVAIWTVAMVLFCFVVFYLLPSGSSRVPAKMESHCVKHEATMLALANQLYDLMPDSTVLEYKPSNGVSLSHVASWDNLWGYPGIEDSIDVNPITFSSTQMDSIAHMLESLHCDRLTIYKPTGLALFDYLTRGFATYWFEVSLVPFTSERVQQQLNTYNAVPFSSHVCFRFHGGATDGDAPFPYKEKYVESLRQRGLI